MLKKIPNYVWTLLALVIGIILGGTLPSHLKPVAEATKTFIEIITKFVPVLIFIALSPAVATLTKKGLAGKFGGSVILWYVFTSTIAGLLGVLVSSLVFKLPVAGGDISSSTAINMLKKLGENGATVPLVSIIAAVFSGIAGAFIRPLYQLLIKIQGITSRTGEKIGVIMIPLILCFGITIGVRFGARLGLEHYLNIILYTVFLYLLWWFLYTFFVKLITRQPVSKILREYLIPVSLFAAGTCSSLVTLPVNLARVKKFGVRNEIADFIVPFGAVANMDGSALYYLAYAPFVITFIYGFEISWTIMLIAWPAIVLFTIASPGLPAGMGTGLWSATLFASMLGIQEPVRSTFIATWVALAGGFPDMLRTAVNCTGDGLTAILYESVYDRHSVKKTVPPPGV
jgi:Na+/H+-dicarboxylate symporter